jgi:hypothetical protein
VDLPFQGVNRKAKKEAEKQELYESRKKARAQARTECKAQRSAKLDKQLFHISAKEEKFRQKKQDMEAKIAAMTEQLAKLTAQMDNVEAEKQNVEAKKQKGLDEKGRSKKGSGQCQHQLLALPDDEDGLEDAFLFSEEDIMTSRANPDVFTAEYERLGITTSVSVSTLPQADTTSMPKTKRSKKYVYQHPMIRQNYSALLGLPAEEILQFASDTESLAYLSADLPLWRYAQRGGGGCEGGGGGGGGGEDAGEGGDDSGGGQQQAPSEQEIQATIDVIRAEIREGDFDRAHELLGLHNEKDRMVCSPGSSTCSAASLLACSAASLLACSAASLLASTTILCSQTSWEHRMVVEELRKTEIDREASLQHVQGVRMEHAHQCRSQQRRWKQQQQQQHQQQQRHQSARMGRASTRGHRQRHTGK